MLLSFKTGSRDALCRIYGKYRTMLLKLAYALCNDACLAEDVVHDIFVSFAQSADRIRVNGSLKSYLATCLVNRVRNVKKRSVRGVCLGANPSEGVAQSVPGPEQWIIRNEQLDRIAQAVGALPCEQAEVVLLHLQAGLKFRKIAEIQKVSINTVQSRYRYGLEKLRSTLDC